MVFLPKQLCSYHTLKQGRDLDKKPLINDANWDMPVLISTLLYSCDVYTTLLQVTSLHSNVFRGCIKLSRVCARRHHCCNVKQRCIFYCIKPQSDVYQDQIFIVVCMYQFSATQLCTLHCLGQAQFPLTWVKARANIHLLPRTHLPNAVDWTIQS